MNQRFSETVVCYSVVAVGLVAWSRDMPGFILTQPFSSHTPPPSQPRGKQKAAKQAHSPRTQSQTLGSSSTFPPPNVAGFLIFTNVFHEIKNVNLMGKMGTGIYLSRRRSLIGTLQ